MERISPLTPAEVDVVLASLCHAVEAKPVVVLDPVFLGTMRLALAAKGAIPFAVKPLPPPPVVQVDVGVDSHAEDLRAARAATEEARSEVDGLWEELASAQAEVLARQEALDSRDLAVRLLQEQAATLNARLAAENARATEIETRLDRESRAASLARTEAAKKLKEAEDKLGIETQAKAGAELRLTKLATALKGFEYGASSTKFSHSGTNKPIPCCPLCGGLKPDGLGKHKEAGHRKGCRVAELFKAAL